MKVVSFNGHLAFFLVVLIPQLAVSANYAFVLGGAASIMQKGGHEFALSAACATDGLRAKGYETTTLFGSVGLFVEVVGTSCEGNKACLKVSSITPLVLSPISELYILKLRAQISSPKRPR